MSSGQHGRNRGWQYDFADTEHGGDVSGDQPEDMEQDWELPDADPLAEADMVVRVRTTMATPLEHTKMVDAMTDMALPEKWVGKVFKHWGKPVVINETKGLLSAIENKRNYARGEALIPGTAEFAFGKCLVAAYRHEPPAAGNIDPCYCLPKLYMNGCCHQSPPIYTTRIRVQDMLCNVCSKCIRCQKLLGRRCSCVLVKSMALVFPVEFPLDAA